jgi:hypothetical protein
LHGAGFVELEEFTSGLRFSTNTTLLWLDGETDRANSVLGPGARALNPRALARLPEAKQRLIRAQPVGEHQQADKRVLEFGIRWQVRASKFAYLGKAPMSRVGQTPDAGEGLDPVFRLPERAMRRARLARASPHVVFERSLVV